MNNPLLFLLVSRLFFMIASLINYFHEDIEKAIFCAILYAATTMEFSLYRKG